MKQRYIFEQWGEIKGTDDLTKSHLVEVVDGNSDFIIDTFNYSYYDPETNSWLEIKEEVK